MRLAKIVFGVLVVVFVALAVNGWRIQRKAAQLRVDDTLQSPAAVKSHDQEQGRGVVAFQRILTLSSPSPETVDSSLREINRKWHPGATVMLLEVLRFARSRHAFTEILGLLQRKSGQTFGNDFDSWYRWIWSRNYDPHPQYAEFKSALYSRIDSRFREYFVKTDNAQIRLDEIRWGGVMRDGIPPLKNPKMIPANQATYLADSNVVFGVSLNGDTRCYPKRILAWHEMFKDTIGGIPVCGVY